MPQCVADYKTFIFTTQVQSFFILKTCQNSHLYDIIQNNKEEKNESNYWGNTWLCMRRMHNNRIPAPGNKIYYQQGCIGPITIHVCYLLYWINFLGTVRGLS